MPDEFDDPHHHQALAFEYYTEAYGTFLRGSDDFEETEQVLEARYGKSAIVNPTERACLFPHSTAKKNETIMSDLESQKALLHQVKAEYEKATLSGVSL